MNIVLVHGAYADGSSWGKVITILKNAGYHVIAVQLPLHSLADDVATVKRTIELVGGPIVLVGHSYGGFVITNAAYNNRNVKALVYVAAFAPKEGQSIDNFSDLSDELIIDSGGFTTIKQEIFARALGQDVNSTEADIMAVAQKPFNKSIFAEKSACMDRQTRLSKNNASIAINNSPRERITLLVLCNAILVVVVGVSTHPFWCLESNLCDH